ncbi:MAG: methionine aminopeptidase type [Acidimicrobiia bacterium]|nr:methionine aminopeptidase type [Acidimicrobiia bacterium]
MSLGGIKRRNAEELALMRRAGAVVAEMHEAIRAAVKPGMTTAALDVIGREVLERRGATSNFLGYHGYPAVICASPNEVIVHGIPGPRVLEEGDIISIDCGAIVGGWHGDGAFTMPVGSTTPEALALIAAADDALAAGIAAMVAGNRLGDVGYAVDSLATERGYQVVEGYGGHGIGQAMHERPSVPNWGQPGKGDLLRVGNTLCLEPMLAVGTDQSETLEDGWTVITLDGSWAAHSEHTILVGDDGPEILTGRR